VACALFALGLAAATTAVVENPLRFLPWLVARPRRSIAMGLACTIAAALVGVAAHRSALARGGEFWHAARDRGALAGTACTLDPNEVTPRVCTFGDTTATRSIVLFGDSHAAQWFSPINALAVRHHLRLLAVTKYSCPVARVAVRDSMLARRFVECEQWREQAIAKVVAMRPAAVIIGHFARRGAVRADANGSLDSLSADDWSLGVRSTLATFDSAGINTLLMRDTPRPGVVIPACLSRAEHRGEPLSTCGVARAAAVDSLGARADVDAVAGLAHVHLADFTDRVCGTTRCEPILNGVVVYLDGNHLSDAFVRRLEPALDSALAPLVRSTGEP
jgi:hypothetical protein